MWTSFKAGSLRRPWMKVSSDFSLRILRFRKGLQVKQLRTVIVFNLDSNSEPTGSNSSQTPPGFLLVSYDTFLKSPMSPFAWKILPRTQLGFMWRCFHIGPFRKTPKTTDWRLSQAKKALVALSSHLKTWALALTHSPVFLVSAELLIQQQHRVVQNAGRCTELTSDRYTDSLGRSRQVCTEKQPLAGLARQTETYQE